MINPINPLGGLDTGLAGPSFFGNQDRGGPAGPGAPGDLAALSPDAQEGQDGEVNEALQQMLQALQQQNDPVEQLKEEIARTEQELQQAQQAGDEERVGQLSEKLAQLLSQLAQLTGGGQEAGGGGPAGAGAPAGGGGGAPAGGGGAPAGAAAPSGAGAPGGGGGPSGGGGGPSGAGAPSAGAGPSDAGAPAEINAVPPDLAGDDKKLAEFIEGKLEGSPLAGKGLGSHFVAAGRKHDVDPMVLAAISKHETNFGRLGVGVSKHMGVGAFDSSPNTPRQWDGAVNQIYSGAKTFANLRSKGGSSSQASLGQQLSAVNRAGWATDSSWHSKVGNHYNSLSRGSNTAVASR